ncbi:MAG: hypothetical protein ACI8XZ_004879 [Gammaproteobacteria bacterium]|jgi:hypothetical protein
MRLHRISHPHLYPVAPRSPKRYCDLVCGAFQFLRTVEATKARNGIFCVSLQNLQRKRPRSLTARRARLPSNAHREHHELV